MISEDEQRAVNEKVERMWLTMRTMMDDRFMEGSEPRRVFYGLPKPPRPFPTSATKSRRIWR